MNYKLILDEDDTNNNMNNNSFIDININDNTLNFETNYLIEKIVCLKWIQEQTLNDKQSYNNNILFSIMVYFLLNFFYLLFIIVLNKFNSNEHIYIIMNGSTNILFIFIFMVYNSNNFDINKINISINNLNNLKNNIQTDIDYYIMDTNVHSNNLLKYATEYNRIIHTSLWYKKYINKFISNFSKTQEYMIYINNTDIDNEVINELNKNLI